MFKTEITFLPVNNYPDMHHSQGGYEICHTNFIKVIEKGLNWANEPVGTKKGTLNSFGPDLGLNAGMGTRCGLKGTKFPSLKKIKGCLPLLFTQSQGIPWQSHTSHRNRAGHGAQCLRMALYTNIFAYMG